MTSVRSRPSVGVGYYIYSSSLAEMLLSRDASLISTNGHLQPNPEFPILSDLEEGPGNQIPRR